MADNTDNGGKRRGSRWRLWGWGIAAFLLLLPLVAMQFTDEVNWDETDFIFAGVLIGGIGIAYELAVRMTGNYAYRAAVGLALAAAFLLIWMNLAVGIIGNEDNPLNLMYGGVLAVALIGALVARFEPEGMARAMIAAAIAQGLVGLIALFAGYFTLVLAAFFMALWLIAASLFRKAAREQTTVRAAP